MMSCVRDTVLTPEDNVEHGGNNWHESGSGEAKKEHVTWDEAHQEGGWQDGTKAPRHASRHKLNVSRLESRGNITVLPLSFTTKSKVWTGGQICTSTNTLYSPSNICARQSLDHHNSQYLQLFAFGRGMNYGFWCFGSNVLVRMCPTTSSDNDSRCSGFLGDDTNGAVFKWRKPIFYCWHQFFTAKKEEGAGDCK